MEYPFLDQEHEDTSRRHFLTIIKKTKTRPGSSYSNDDTLRLWVFFTLVV